MLISSTRVSISGSRPRLSLAVVSECMARAQHVVARLQRDPELQVVTITLHCASESSSISPDVVILDVEPCADSISAFVRGLRVQFPGSRIVLLGIDETKEQLLDAFEAGAVAYIQETDSVAKMRAAIEAVCNGEVVCSARTALLGFRRLEELRRAEMIARLMMEYGLSFRESEVLKLIASGFTNDEVADQLRLSIHTVRNHVHRVLTKLEARSRYELIARFR